MSSPINWGKVLIYLGLIIAIAGGLISYFNTPFSWIGHLPGDIKVERENVTFYLPIATTIIISLVINIIIFIIKYLTRL